MLFAVYMRTAFRQQQCIVVTVFVCFCEAIVAALPPMFCRIPVFLFILCDTGLVFCHFYAFAADARERRSRRSVSYELYRFISGKYFAHERVVRMLNADAPYLYFPVFFAQGFEIHAVSDFTVGFLQLSRKELFELF